MTLLHCIHRTIYHLYSILSHLAQTDSGCAGRIALENFLKVDIGDTRLWEESGGIRGVGDEAARPSLRGGFKMIIVESMPLHGRGPKQRTHH